MDSWIFQPGYPLVERRLRRWRTWCCASSVSSISGTAPHAGHDQLWQVPVAVRYEGAGGPQTHGVLLDDSTTRVALPDDFRSLTVNAGGNGVFRVRYSPELQAKLTTDVQITLSAIERFNLVNDTWATVLAGYTPLMQYLDLTELFRDEAD